MIISDIKLKNFRNYEELDISFDEGINIIYGDNAQGKTNILESAYISGTSKSHKGSRDREMIRFGEDEGHICTTVIKNGGEYRIDIHLRKNKAKGIAINRVPIKKAADLFGILNIIFFSPEDLDIVKDGPSERRRFMDSELCQLDKVYLYNLTNYNKVLNQRNKLLKDIYYDSSLKDTLFAWDEKLIEYGKAIIKRRKRFIDEISPIVKEIHFAISGEKEELIIAYEPDVYDMFFADELIRARDRDLRFGQTSVGPHRDDIDFKISGTDVRKYASQGQKRSCALSLKLSEIKLVENEIGEKPVLLLDDVFSELDGNRQSSLLKGLNNAQTLITCTGLDEFVKSNFSYHRLFHVKNGTVEVENA